ncbi:hypothetical protein [Anaerosacchariphilus polymeriproducens]|uniref:Uncharacterized protein n=1 Tax=Anaerosacchariphilus polymeriproducens TaxID=1812858 RepID=A0A371AZ71_9FIRM|nr:hypothetical protein [Anaerosacchariphilus polymeriproducens]RDU24895.1 hypothetical protein DWV06_01300 [Anaerosacchariphilus polymeriproducens]
MIKKNLKKVMATTLMGLIMLSSTGVVHAATASTVYGKMIYDMESDYDWVSAWTTMPTGSGRYSYIKTTLEVQDNSTGLTLFKKNSKSTYTYDENTTSVYANNMTTTSLAAFSCHEVVGQIAYAKYMSSTF